VLLEIVHGVSLAGIGAAALVWLRRRPTLGTWLSAGILSELIALILTLLLGTDRHLPSRLASYAVFAFTPALLLAAAFVLRRAARKTAFVSLGLAVVVTVVGVDAFFIEPHWLEVTFTRLESAKLSRPVRVVLIADLQTDEFGPYEREALAQVASLQPDLILWAGDYVQAPPEQLDALRKQFNQYLKELKLRARLGAYAVAGNMDRGSWEEMFADTGVRVHRRTQALDLGDLVLTCLSIEHSFRPDAALPAVPENRFHLVLGHSPDCALSRARADLMLAGHTHGGQVRLPLLGPIITLSKVPRSMAVGLAQRHAGGWLYVSRGVGMERGRAPRIRFLCRPELAVIDLVPAAGKSK